MTRMSAEERREQVARAAAAEFSIRGLEGTSTGDIAKRVGVSQPYLFRLFPTKRDLFIAAVEYSAAQIHDVFTKAAEGKYGQAALAAMGDAYQGLLMADRTILNMQLQQFAACHDPEVRDAVRGAMRRMWQHVENLSGAPVGARVDYFAKGMLCNTISAMGWDQDGDAALEAAEAAKAEECGTAAEGTSDEEWSGIPGDLAYAAYIEKAFTS